jgi:hypothetical protein
VQPDHLSPREWLERRPLEPSEQLFAVFGNASSAEPFKAWRTFNPLQRAHPIWADTAYAEWDPVMPYVGIVAADSEFLEWVATSASDDWGWLGISSSPPHALVEHFRSLTQVLLPNGNAVFFRFWDGRYVLPVLQSTEVDGAHLLPVVGRCLINGQPLEIGGKGLEATRVFPWWEVSNTLLEQLAEHSDVTRINNLLNWLSENRPDLFEAFSDSVLRHKVAVFLKAPDLPPAPTSALVDYLLMELD